MRVQEERPDIFPQPQHARVRVGEDWVAPGEVERAQHAEGPLPGLRLRAFSFDHLFLLAS